MSYNKVYENKPIWHNDREPSINEARLNALSNATDIIDNRVIELGDRGVENLPDVSITDLQDGQGIKWNEELQKWENGVVGGIVDITNAEYEYLVEHDLDDRTVTYNITDRNPDGTLIDDSLTESATKTWSINNLSSKFSAINSKLENKYGTLLDVNSNISNLNYTLRKFGNVVELSGRCTFATESAGTKTMFKLPSGFYRNGQHIEISWYDNTLDMPCCGRINENSVYLYSTTRNTQTLTTWYFNATYIV